MERRGCCVVTGLRPRPGAFSLIEVIAVLVVAGLMTGLAAVSLRGVTRIERLDDAADRLRLLDERVRVLAERERRPWNIVISETGVDASPAEDFDAARPGVLQVRLRPTLAVEAWIGRVDAAALQPPWEVRVNAEGASPDYGWRIRHDREDEEPVKGGSGSAEASVSGRFAGRTGQFLVAPLLDDAMSVRTGATQ